MMANVYASYFPQVLEGKENVVCGTPPGRHHNHVKVVPFLHAWNIHSSKWEPAEQMEEKNHPQFAHRNGGKTKNR